MINIRIDKAQRCPCDTSIFLSFPYDGNIVNIVRALPNRFWNKDTKEWEVPFAKIETLITQLPNESFDITGVLPEKQSAELPAGFAFKTQPFSHQLDGFKYGFEHSHWLLGDEQGLGKTKQVIDIAVARKLKFGYKHCLVVCGVNGLKWNWVSEIKTHSNENAWILGQRFKGPRLQIGGNADKLADVKSLISGNAPISENYFLITNVETLRNEEIAAELAKLCKSGVINMVAIDEIHKCKNPSSQQGKGILKLQPECRIAMTGTPLMNNPLDLFIILKWLGYESHSFYAFKNHYCVFGGYGGYEIINYKNLDSLQETLNSVMLRRLKNDVLDLPAKIHVTEYTEMTPKQEQIYKEVTAEIKANIDQIKMANNPLAELIRMRQATGYTGILSSTVKESAKLDRMEELVEEAVENGKKVVIFSNWTQMTSAFCDRLRTKYGIGLITGETPDSNRQNTVNLYQEGKLDVIIGTIGAMGTGLTLTAGTVEIFMDEPWNRANKEQAEDRCHRVGTTENITIYTLICKGTIDERIHELIEKKGALADMLVDGKISATNKEELLNFLLN